MISHKGGAAHFHINGPVTSVHATYAPASLNGIKKRPSGREEKVISGSDKDEYSTL